MTGKHLDDAIDQAKQSLQRALNDSCAPTFEHVRENNGIGIRVENAGNVANTIHIDQQTQHVGK